MIDRSFSHHGCTRHQRERGGGEKVADIYHSRDTSQLEPGVILYWGTLILLRPIFFIFLVVTRTSFTWQTHVHCVISFRSRGERKEEERKRKREREREERREKRGKDRGTHAHTSLERTGGRNTVRGYHGEREREKERKRERESWWPRCVQGAGRGGGDTRVSWDSWNRQKRRRTRRDGLTSTEETTDPRRVASVRPCCSAPTRPRLEAPPTLFQPPLALPSLVPFPMSVLCLCSAAAASSRSPPRLLRFPLVRCT